MPLLEEISDIDNTRLVLWDMGNEDILSFIPDLPDHIHHPKRIREHLTTQKMKSALGLTEPISYLENGKPYIENGPSISISHGSEVAGFIRSDKTIGLDIQLITPQLGRIRNKYCHPDELKVASESNNVLEYLTLLWSAKEAVFKMYGEGLVFAEQIRIGPIDENRKIAKATVYRGNDSFIHEVKWNWIRNHAVVWSI
jgi:4'-phosphopantetheinyl transferase